MSLVINDVISNTCLDKIVLDLPITFLVCCRSRNGAFSTVFLKIQYYLASAVSMETDLTLTWIL